MLPHALRGQDETVTSNLFCLVVTEIVFIIPILRYCPHFFHSNLRNYGKPLELTKVKISEKKLLFLPDFYFCSLIFSDEKSSSKRKSFLSLITFFVQDIRQKQPFL